MTVIQQIEEDLKSGMPIAQVAEKNSVSRKTVRKVRDGEPVDESRLKDSNTNRIGMSEEEFRRKYDPETKLRNQLEKAIGFIKPSLIYRDCDLRREVGCSDHRYWKDISEDPREKYHNYMFCIGKEVFWAEPEMVQDILESNPRASEVIPS